MTICIFFFLAVACSVICAQDAQKLFDKARSIRMSDIDSSNWFTTQAYHKSLESKNDTLALKAQFLLGMNLQMQVKLDEAIDVYQQVIGSTPTGTYPEQFIQSFGRIGDCYSDLGAFDSSLVYLLEFDQLVDQHWSEYKIDAKLLLGELYRAMGRPEQSSQYQLEAIKRSEKSGIRMERILALYYYLEDHRDEMHTESFQKYFEDYIELTANSNQEKTKGYSHVTMFLDGLSDDEKIGVLERAIDQIDQTGHHTSLLMYHSTLINVYISKYEFDQALPYAKEGKAIAIQKKDKRFESDFNFCLYQIYEGLQKYDQAVKSLYAHYSIKDSLGTIAMNKNLDELNVQYQSAQKEKMIVEQDLALKQSNYQRNLLFGGLVMALWFGAFLGIYFWNRNRVAERLALQETRIKEQKIHQLEQEKSLLAMSSMIEGQETERKRIAQDLHDGLGGLLSNMKAQLHDIERRVDALTGTDLYGKARSMIDEASKEVRRIAYNMMPVALSRLGLKAAIEDLASRVTSHHDIAIDLQLLSLENRLEETIEVMLYRIVQELCNNVVKHADASTLMIQTTQIENDLILVVEDNGKGFDPSHTSTQNGVGMKSLSSRVKYLNGNLDIASSEKGTCVTVQVPL